MPAALFEGRANFFQLARNWILSFFGNLAGSLIVVWLVDEVSTAPACLADTPEYP